MGKSGMRRWVWRGSLAVVVAALALSTAVGVKAFTRACDGSLEGLRYLSNVRSQLASATAAPPTPPAPTPPPAPTVGQAQPALPTPTRSPTSGPAGPTVPQRALDLAGRAGDTVLLAFIRVKQADEVAYPAHIMAAHTLSIAGCSPDAVRLQWIKAGLHAGRDGQPERVAAALVESASGPDELADLRRVVRTWTERASQSVSLRPVLAALDARAASS